MLSCQASSNDTTLYTTLPTTRHMVSSTIRTHTGKQAARRQACTKAYTKTAIRLPARQQQSIMPNTSQTRCNSVHAAAHIAKRQADTRPTPYSPTARQTRCQTACLRHAQHAACPTTQDDAHTQHAHSRHEDSNTKTASQTTSKHAATSGGQKIRSDTNDDDGSYPSYQRYIASDDGSVIYAEFLQGW